MNRQMRGPKIAINGRFLLQDITGVQRVEREILSALDAMVGRGEIEAPVVLLPQKGKIVGSPNLQHIELQRVGSLSGHLWEQLELPGLCRGKMLWCLGNTAPVRSLLSGKTRVLTMVHDLSYKYFPRAYSWKFRTLYGAVVPIALRRSDILVTVSNSEKENMSRHFPALRKAENRFFVAPNGGIPDALRDAALEHQSRPSQDRRYGIYVGSLSRRKNADGILKASVRFLMSYPDMRFVIIGASSNVFETLDVDIPVEVRDRLEMRGQINDPAQIYDALSGARFLLFPSFFESSGLPPMEAMTFGCPVIASDIASLNERCGDAALYCDPDDQEDIANKIQCLMDDDALWSEKSSAGKLIAKTFSWASQARKLLELSGCRHE